MVTYGRRRVGFVVVTRIGVVGPWEWMGRLASVTDEFPRIVFRLLGYRCNDEIPDIIAYCRGFVDGFLFCGQTAERLATPHLPSEFPISAIKYDSHAVVRTLYRILRDNPGVLQRGISLDTLSEDEVREVCIDLNIERRLLHCIDLRGIAQLNEVVAYHVAKYASGQVAAVATGMQGAYRLLTAQGLLAYYVRPTITAVREAICHVIGAVHQSRSRDAQVAVVMVEMDRFDESTRPIGSSVDGDGLRVGLYELVQRISRRAKCSLTIIGEGMFLLFATKQSLAQLAGNSFEMDLLKQAYREYGAVLNVGMGLGETTAEAHDNARVGLSSARRSGGGVAFLVYRGGEIVGPIGGSTTAAAPESFDPRMCAIARQAGVSISTIAHLAHNVQLRGQSLYTSIELADTLSVSPRSARRTLAVLCDRGLARIVSERREGSMGRPRYVYDLDLTRLSTPRE